MGKLVIFQCVEASRLMWYLFLRIQLSESTRCQLKNKLFECFLNISFYELKSLVLYTYYIKKHDSIFLFDIKTFHHICINASEGSKLTGFCGTVIVSDFIFFAYLNLQSSSTKRSPVKELKQFSIALSL